MLKLTEINGLLEYATSIKEELQGDFGCIVEIVSEYKSWGFNISIRLLDNHYNLYQQYNSGVFDNYIDYVRRLTELKLVIKDECFGV